MNDKQRYLFIAIVILLTIAIFFPPFQLVAQSAKLNQGFHFILSPNRMEIVNTSLLFMEWLFIISLGFIGWLFFKDGILVKKE
ncbi:MAG: hypothetical protein KBA53_13815 [Thermoclostridium sp.]|nr:hypothetical protein [Thermoclostridium sp.]